MLINDAPEGVHADISTNISAIRNVDRCSPNDVSRDLITPSTYMLHNTDEEHKATHLEEDPHLHKPCLHDNLPVEFYIPIGMLPFLVISDTNNMDSATCEVFVSNSCENT